MPGWIVRSLALAAVVWAGSGAVAQETPPFPGAHACQGRIGTYWCSAREVCNPETERCAMPVTPGPDEILCADQLSTCPKDKECNMDGVGSQRCLTPGSVRCEFRAGPHWCKPGEVCDVEKQKCSEPVKPAEGEVLCPDGLTACPSDGSATPRGRATTAASCPGRYAATCQAGRHGASRGWSAMSTRANAASR